MALIGTLLSAGPPATSVSESRWAEEYSGSISTQLARSVSSSDILQCECCGLQDRRI